MPIRILHTITSLETGGAETMLYRLVKAMDCRNFNHVVLSLGKEGKVGEKIVQAGIQVYSLGLQYHKPNPKIIWDLHRILRGFCPHIIQGWMYHGNLLGQWAGKWAGIPVIWNIRQSLGTLSEEKYLTSFLIRIGAVLSYMPSQIIYNAFCSALDHEAIGYKKEKRLVLPNGFDTEIFCPSYSARKRIREELHIPQEAFLVGLIARYHPVKDHRTFFEAANAFSQKYSDVHFLLAGKDIHKKNQEIQSLLANFQNTGRLHLLGERDDTAKITAALDIATCCSKSEALANTVGEAMSCAVPCVVTDVGDLRILVGETGLVIEKENKDALSQAWEKIYCMSQEEKKRLGQKARERILSDYSLSKCIQRYSALYQEKSLL